MTVDPVWNALMTARSCLERLIRDHRQVTASMAAGPPQSRTLDGVRAQADLTPVEAQAAQRIHQGAGYYQTLIDHALANLTAADRVRSQLTIADTKQAAALLRCDGGHGEWDDPTCEREGVKDVWVGGVHHWLCQQCWNRYRQWKHRHEGAA